MFSGQILREYLVVATRPAENNGLGLSAADAVSNVRAFRGRTTLLAEGGRVAGRLLRLLDDTACGGRQIHDAHVVATMIVHDIGAVVTMNVDDFARFSGHVSLLRL